MRAQISSFPEAATARQFRKEQEIRTARQPRTEKLAHRMVRQLRTQQAITAEQPRQVRMPRQTEQAAQVSP